MEDVPLQARLTIEGVSAINLGCEKREKPPASLSGGGQSLNVGLKAYLIAVLLPTEEEEGFITSIVQVWNLYRSAERAAKIVLAVAGYSLYWLATRPWFGVHGFVVEQLKDAAMIRISARLGCETLNASRCVTKLSRRS